MANLLMVIDVESIGLHGEGFAVAWQVATSSHADVLAQGLWACPPEAAAGSAPDRAWVAAHLPVLPVNCPDPSAVRQHFWADWLHWRQQGAWMLADCAWPVEARFLNDCIRDGAPDAGQFGPWPLLDLALARALWPELTTLAQQRLPDELPVHDPRADVRQTLRLWHHWRKLCAGAGTPSFDPRWEWPGSTTG